MDLEADHDLPFAGFGLSRLDRPCHRLPDTFPFARKRLPSFASIGDMKMRGGDRGRGGSESGRVKADESRFAGLDLLRGVAAFAVLVLHAPWPSSVRPPLPRGYLAVDLFFVLSGFVLAHAYRHRLGSAAQLGQYCRARLIRLYPLYCIATLLSSALLGIFSIFGHGGAALNSLSSSLAIGIFLLPTPSAWSVAPAVLFPLVFVAWSLFWELIVNLLYGAVSAQLGWKLLALLIGVGLAGVVLALNSYGRADNLGVAWTGAWSGGARALFSFFAGVALFRVRQRYRAPRMPALLAVAALLLSLVPQSFGGWSYELACMVLLFPLLVWVGAEASMGPRLRAAGNFAGYLSYPVYLLQVPFALMLAPLFVRAARIVPLSGTLEAVIQVVAIIGLSWLVARWFDSPIRDGLRRQFASRAPRPQAETAP